MSKFFKRFKTCNCNSTNTVEPVLVKDDTSANSDSPTKIPELKPETLYLGEPTPKLVTPISAPVSDKTSASQSQTGSVPVTVPDPTATQPSSSSRRDESLPRRRAQRMPKSDGEKEEKKQAGQPAPPVVSQDGENPAGSSAHVESPIVPPADGVVSPTSDEIQEADGDQVEGKRDAMSTMGYAMFSVQLGPKLSTAVVACLAFTISLFKNSAQAPKRSFRRVSGAWAAVRDFVLGFWEFMCTRIWVQTASAAVKKYWTAAYSYCSSCVAGIVMKAKSLHAAVCDKNWRREALFCFIVFLAVAIAAAAYFSILYGAVEGYKSLVAKV